MPQHGGLDAVNVREPDNGDDSLAVRLQYRVGHVSIALFNERSVERRRTSVRGAAASAFAPSVGGQPMVAAASSRCSAGAYAAWPF